jgi:hypothetical protein
MFGSAVATIVPSTEARHIGSVMEGNTLKNCARVTGTSGSATADVEASAGGISASEMACAG